MFYGEIGTPVYQLVGNNKGPQVAELTRWINHFDFSNNPPNPPIRIAAGIARVLPNIEVSQEIPGIGPIKGIATEVKKGDIVRVIGRKAGIVESKVKSENAKLTKKDTLIGSWDIPSRVMLEGMILVDKVVDSDDAGAPVLSTDNRLIGIVCWSTSNFTVVMPIGPILNEFNLQIEGD